MQSNHDTGKEVKKSKIKSYLHKYLITVGAIVGVFAIVSGAAVLAYSSMVQPVEADSGVKLANPKELTTNEEPVENVENNEPDEQIEGDKTSENENLLMDGLFAAPRKTNILILGTDQSSLLSDVIIVGCYDSVTGKIEMISIPRDTYVTLSSEDRQSLKDKGRNAPSVMKLTDLHSYAGSEYGHEYSQKMVESLLDIEIDYYVEIDLEAFRYIVDAVGGIEMEIRAQGFQYKDPYQNLVINVPGGLVLLNGEMAEGALRYRHDYANGDLDRILVQQEFMKQFFIQVLDKDSIIGNLPKFYTMLNKYVKTDFGADKLLLYLDAVKKLSPDNIEFHMLPGEPYDDYSTGKKISYYKHHANDSLALASEIFNNHGEQEIDETEPPASELSTLEPLVSELPASEESVDLKNMRIQVLNGGNISGKAGDVRDLLRTDGYTVSSLGNYKGSKKEQTRIMIKRDFDATALIDYFDDAVVEVDSFKEDYDIIIIIGTGEK